MNKSPAFQFYPDDFLGSGKVGVMTIDEVGVYALLLCLDWNDGGFVYDEEELPRWCRCTKAQFVRAWRRVQRAFVQREDGRFYNPRLEQERAKQHAYRERQRNAADKRWESQRNAVASASALPVECSPSPTPSPSPKQQPSVGSDDPPPPKRKLTPTPDEALVIAHDKHLHPKRRPPDDKALRKLRQQLGVGFTVAEICAALSFASEDEWSVRTGNHSIGYVCRDQATLERYIAKAEAENRPIVGEDGAPDALSLSLAGATGITTDRRAVA